MIEIKKWGKIKPFSKSKIKRQIIICSTLRPAGVYLQSLKYRHNGEYGKVPNYVITREGDILNILPDLSYRKFFNDDEINQNSIIICLENLGWLKQLPLKTFYSNWIGDIYKEDVFEKKWREKDFWQPFTEKQINGLSELCEQLFNKHSIKNKFIGHNTKVDGIRIFEGVVCKSNFDTKYTDVSPAFDFEFLKQDRNE
jgi:N-acetylmuramoyl-L-alanine amidase